MDDKSHIALLKKKLIRAELTRKESERLLETKSRELFEAKRILELAANKLQLKADLDAEMQAYQSKMEGLLLKYGRLFLQQAPDRNSMQELIAQLTDNVVISCYLSIYEMEDVDIDGRYLSGCNVSWQGEPNDLRLQHTELSLTLQLGDHCFGDMRCLVNSKAHWLETIKNQLSLLCEMISAALGRQKTLSHAIAAKQRAEDSERSTRDFLAMINHELRTPLHGVLGSAELLGQTALSSSQLELLHSLNQSGEVLRNIINDLLDYSKMNAGMLELCVKPFSPQQLSKDLLALFQLRANEKQLFYQVELLPELPNLLMGDIERIKQILSNLIGNAMKFTIEGFVKVKLFWQEEQFVVEVKDSGIGIPQDQLGKLFKPFSQVDSSSRRQHEGTGLGLAICKTLAEQMSGDIQLESRLNHGTLLRLTLPLAVSHEVMDAKPSEASPIHGLDTLRVLIAEDIKTNQMIISMMLKRMKVIHEIVNNGQEAVETALNQDFDVILMDCRMPLMDGYQATKTLREKAYSRPIVALTAGTSKTEREACIECGMDDIVYKPYKYEDVYECLLKWRSPPQ